MIAQFITASVALFAPHDYGDPAAWLCRPGRSEACAIDNSATIVAADGSLTREPWSADPSASIDCFYVYPTVSTDTTPNSDMIPGPAETGVVKAQLSRFASVCRPFAPMYRQVTLARLFRWVRGDTAGLASSQAVAYDDVRDAWRHYVEHDNNGRGVVLIGHSQGASILAELIRREIDGKPVQSRLVSAILAGASVAVPRNKEVGGSSPSCRFVPPPRRRRRRISEWSAAPIRLRGAPTRPPSRVAQASSTRISMCRGERLA